MHEITSFHDPTPVAEAGSWREQRELPSLAGPGAAPTALSVLSDYVL